ncbi:hypothetical protein P9A14_16930 [Gordonia hongkongensis]|uniref:Uncharacterized protein n=1 Tax=Gordonia hongkongensis TaxID=1701090 RepID=A0AAX3T3T6_9ACTN|nr:MULTISPECIES: hypothetical protein [Gordonia]MDF6103734.1 hypothetical protein [Gordonia hongkongensis]QIK47156.1 hypothetical protein G8C36_07820 [Gordonia terrae]WFP23814.1 hypothetical protein P9A14_16930 [Gordonia hongkongensis]WGJ84505.1 hypothetical protein QAD21_17290 [Gordonia sp. SMJS1]
MLLTVTFTLLIAALVVVLVVQWQRGRNPQPVSAAKASQFVQGTFTVVGVSDRDDEPTKSAADKDGNRFCTISGTIVGPETSPTEVYGTLVLGAGDPWPQVGDDLPVLYKPQKAATSWRFGVMPEAGPGPV